MMNSFLQLRKHHKLENTEDYVELIYDLIGEKKTARLIDIAKRMSVSKATAHKTVARLHKQGFITALPYADIQLTRRGLALAKNSKRRHQIVLAFLKTLGVSERAAQVDAEGIEHHVSEDTLQAMKQFVETHA